MLKVVCFASSNTKEMSMALPLMCGPKRCDEIPCPRWSRVKISPVNILSSASTKVLLPVPFSPKSRTDLPSNMRLRLSETPLNPVMSSLSTRNLVFDIRAIQNCCRNSVRVGEQAFLTQPQKCFDNGGRETVIGSDLSKKSVQNLGFEWLLGPHGAPRDFEFFRSILTPTTFAGL